MHFFHIKHLKCTFSTKLVMLFHLFFFIEKDATCLTYLLLTAPFCPSLISYFWEGVH